MDTILEEDWSDYEKKYPYRSDTFDRQGRPGKLFPSYPVPFIPSFRVSEYLHRVKEFLQFSFAVI